ncbi:hypothetical protein TNIN_270201 [Trichonephila inaurata madagascariensis]|uniref:Uncharacterized protein n=1 Tax=Trichonephila inaurata madagascariensis TaxID=2747483 RepID=A0A8X6X6H0_9ARAC|nr:hypothetical protein TNIN_270201 [Trichonephila inaurata madagascariensis]
MPFLQELSRQEVNFQREQAKFAPLFEREVTQSTQFLQQEQAEVAVTAGSIRNGDWFTAGEAMRLLQEQEELTKWVKEKVAQTAQRQ